MPYSSNRRDISSPFAPALLYTGSLAFLFLFLLPSLQTKADEYRATRISTEQGLPHSIVYSLLVDSRGFLWIATRDGLTRYDGYSFTTYWDRVTHQNVLTEDSQGNIWSGTPEGLCRFNRKTGTFTTFKSDTSNPASISNNSVYSTHRDQNGILWVGTDNGLNRFDPSNGSFRRYFFQAGRRQSITCLMGDQRGTLWTGVRETDSVTGDDILRIYYRLPWSNEFHLIPIGPELADQFSYPVRMFHDDEGIIWVILNSPKRQNTIRRTQLIALRIDPQTMQVVDTITTVFSKTLKGGLFDAHGGDLNDNSSAELPVIFSSLFHGDKGIYSGRITFNREKTRATSFTLEYPPIQPYGINGLDQDLGGLLWAGSDDGLTKVSPASFFFPPPIRINTPDYGVNALSRVRAIYRDNRGDLWVGTDAQLLQYRSGSNQVIDHTNYLELPDNLHNTAVNVIYEVPHFLVIGTNSGLFYYDPAGRKILQPYKSTFRRKIRSLAHDKQGNLWVGTISNLMVFAPDNRMIYQKSLGTYPKRLEGAVWELTCDSKGRMWGGTEKGLYRWDSSRQSPVYYHHVPNDPHSLPKGSVWEIHEDRTGRIWVGVYGGGLARYRPETDDFVSISTKDGLPSNGICAILEDSVGNLWLSTSNGLACYILPPSDSVPEKNETYHILTYTTADGLAGKEFALKASWCDRDGVLYFGGVNQITRFNPTTLPKNSHVPPLAVTSFRANDSLISLELLDGDSVTLPYWQNHLAIEFAALDFLNPEGNMYAFMLEGIDKRWNYSGNRRFASYSGLNPGKYILLIRGANSHGVWNNKGIRIYITITPPLWRTWWFQSVIAAVILSVGFSWYRGRQRRRSERMERQIIEAKLQALRLQMKPHFIFNSLNSIHSFILLHKSDEASQYLTKFARLIRIALYHSQHSFIAFQDEVRFLRLYLELEALRFDDSFSYDIILAPEILLDTLQLPSMLIQPYVENAIHHGLRNKAGGKLLIQFALDEPDVLHCTIIDNGIGRKAAQAFTQRKEVPLSHLPMGTSVTQQRLELLNSIYESKFHVQIIDQYDNEGNPCGTKVVLHIRIEQYGPKQSDH